MSACTRDHTDDGHAQTLIRVTLQTDWFPQPEHGGFYQALANGYFREAGLDVEILPGGPNAMTVHKVLRGNAHFAMNRIDTILTLVEQNMPLTMVMATLQHDPQALMLHASHPAQSIADLDGATVMAIPGLTWISWVERRYGITLNIIPHDFGMERFLQNPLFIQQCLLTNEPYFVRKAGANPKVFPLADSGFDPYHGIYALSSTVENNPDLVRAFVKASQRGWQSFIFGDPAPALALIAERNPRMTPEFMEFAVSEMRARHLVEGRPEIEAFIGELRPQRVAELHDELVELGVLKRKLDWQSAVRFDFAQPLN
ncbi:MAG: ABC transporter substrate-binding protein [Verrucomicrobia bacterium]|nr:ABC transporter substrate-binding protein [Verrucomicrobiota bacterium]